MIKGSGDPKLVLERIWLLLRRVQQAGVREIRGDIVLDRSAFSVPEQSPGEFDGEPLRPYNAQPDALLLNYKSLLLNFTPDATRGVAMIAADPPLACPPRCRGAAARGGGLRRLAQCAQARRERSGAIRFLGHYASGCGQKTWPLAYAEPASYNARLIEALWREAGGRLTGVVRDGAAPTRCRASRSHRRRWPKSFATSTSTATT